MPVAFTPGLVAIDVAGTVAVLAVGGYLARNLLVERAAKWIDRRVDHQFADKLETRKGEITKDVERYKRELDDRTEQLKSGLQREYYRFSLYEQKRHEIYAALFAKMTDAVLWAALAYRLDRFAAQGFSLADVGDLSEMQTQIAQLELTPNDRAAVMTIMRANSDPQQRRVAFAAAKAAVDEGARQAHYTVGHYFSANSLYLSQAVRTAAAQFVNQVIAPPFDRGDWNVSIYQQLLDRAGDAMRSELSGAPVPDAP